MENCNNILEKYWPNYSNYKVPLPLMILLMMLLIIIIPIIMNNLHKSEIDTKNAQIELLNQTIESYKKDVFSLEEKLKTAKISYTSFSKLSNSELKKKTISIASSILSLSYKQKLYDLQNIINFDNNKKSLYFHTAFKGLKLDYINKNPKVCATVVEDRGYIMNKCEHAYRSVVFWGQMKIVDDLNEKKHGMQILLNHLEEEPEIVKQRSLQDNKVYDDVCILRFDISEITGKEGS